MTALFDPAPWWLMLAGWSVIVALWHTSVVALAFGTWRLWRRSAPATTQYQRRVGRPGAASPSSRWSRLRHSCFVAAPRRRRPWQSG